MENEEKKAPIEFWSCDPKSIKPWTKEDEERLHVALAKIFGKPKDEKAD